MNGWVILGVIGVCLVAVILVIVWMISGLNDQERVGK